MVSRFRFLGNSNDVENYTRQLTFSFLTYVDLQQKSASHVMIK